ncbi:MAG: FAD-dependent oxidoreductase [Propionibacteriales bacterium]|nr:FAD-dependent oxidoreductase [Propionibacteriales bacterium]
MTTTSPQPPFVIAVVGAGPSGIYAAEALAHQNDVDARVVVIDRLPVPFGLVRYGVAPDHPSIRSVRTTLERTLSRDNVTFYGDVTIGRDLTVAELRSCVDACVFAFGAATSRRLGIPGEDAIGSIGAPDFVSWYTGNPDLHPDRVPGAHPPVDHGGSPSVVPTAELLADVRSAVVVGAGNVALDVVRILIKDADELAATDMADEVLTAMRAKQITDVHLLARRGPSDTTMTTKEVRELGRINGCDVIIGPDDLDWVAEENAAVGKVAQRNMAEFLAWAGGPRRLGASRRIHLHFWVSPTDIEVTDSPRGERVSGVRVADTRPGASATHHLPAGLVVRAIGYRGVALPGLPYDPATGGVPHDEGRVLDDRGPGPARTINATYVTGWIKRGPTGVIGTNKSDATETVQSLLHDIDEGDFSPQHPEGLESLAELLRHRGITPLDLPAWHRIDAAEVDHGQATGRERATLAHRSELRAAAHGPDSGQGREAEGDHQDDQQDADGGAVVLDIEHDRQPIERA